MYNDIRTDVIRGGLINIGYQSENETRRVWFSLEDFKKLGDGVMSLTVQRNGDTDGYPVIVEEKELDGKPYAVWTVADGDVAKRGYGSVQLTYTIGDRIAKSQKWNICINDSLGATEEPPEPFETYVERVEKARQGIEDMTVSAEVGETAGVEKTVIDDIVNLHFTFPQSAISDEQIEEIAELVKEEVDVPTKTSDLDNDSGFITSEDLNGYATDEDLSELADIVDAKASELNEVKAKIPNQASAENKLADKNFVNSSVSTNTAFFLGTFNSVAELEAYSGTKTPNDYAFVIGSDTYGNTLYNRYKWNGTSWLFEYSLNNSSFTAQQWASVNSGVTSSDVEQVEENKQAILLKANKDELPTKTSDLTNDSGFLTLATLPVWNGGVV